MPTTVRPVLLLSAALLLLGGCAATPEPLVGPAARPDLDAARSVPLFDGVSGEAMAWEEMIDRIENVDVVVIGETHTDAMGHAVQAAVVEDMVSRWSRTTLAMEMLERDEQGLIDDYLEEVIEQEVFAERTGSTTWAGPGSWDGWYQPIIDAAKSGHEDGARVVGANAPRRYVKLARSDGYERLEAFPPPRREWFEIPPEPSGGRYAERFRGFMTGHDPTMETDDGTEEEEWTEEDEERLQSVFRSQSVWDATMGGSIADALEAGADKVVLLVGQFHSDYDGGTIQQLRFRRPGVRVLVISLQPEAGSGLRDEDDGRADVIVFTGE